jgi:hypothetical protein
MAAEQRRRDDAAIRRTRVGDLGDGGDDLGLSKLASSPGARIRQAFDVFDVKEAATAVLAGV